MIKGQEVELREVVVSNVQMDGPSEEDESLKFPSKTMDTSIVV